DFGPSIESAAAILRTCDALDEAIEFSPYDAQPLPAAIRDFMLDAEPGDVISALGDLIRPGSAINATERLPVLPSAAAALLRVQPDTVSAAELAAIAEK